MNTNVATSGGILVARFHSSHFLSVRGSSKYLKSIRETPFPNSEASEEISEVTSGRRVKGRKGCHYLIITTDN